MESHVQIRCMKKDVQLIRGIISQCVSEFQTLIKKECNRDIKCEISIDENNYLENANW